MGCVRGSYKYRDCRRLEETGRWNYEKTPCADYRLFIAVQIQPNTESYRLQTSDTPVFQSLTPFRPDIINLQVIARLSILYRLL